jgi:hypothetical protein
VVLLFAEERGRRRGPLDRARRWGVLCSYVVLLLSSVRVLSIGALILIGIAAALMDLPLNYQPRVTPLFAAVGVAWIRYGPQPKDVSDVVLVAFSSIAILLACIPLFDALRSSGRKGLAVVVLAPLALFALVYLAETARYFAALGVAPVADVVPYAVYFRPDMFVERIFGVPPAPGVSVSAGAAWVEAVKWCSVLAIAVWLSVARLTRQAAGGAERVERARQSPNEEVTEWGVTG